MKILITGGLGFIGINAAEKLSTNNQIFIVDNLSRKGNIQNYNKISKNPNVTLHVKDIRNYHDLVGLFEVIKPDVVIHLAGQVAVTSSVANPREDFEINLLGTFNILECIRLYNKNCILLFSSTNKVYGDYKGSLIESKKRYDLELKKGVDESVPLDFHSPYGCSKGGADQYVRDYSRIYNLKTIVLRQSCIYGENQFGIEDQGWVAWFTIASTFNKPFFIYGDGKQVRDILYVKDLVDLYEKLILNIDKCCGQIFNVGGGYENSLSLLELLEILEYKLNRKINYSFSEWRPGDQKIYVSDISKLKSMIGWEPKTFFSNGIDNLHKWVLSNEETLKELKLV
jgi:CDP-paratose 2-epimerase